MGFTERQVLWKVELPLAIPEIIAGLRVATASTIAIATLVVLISAGGLGTEMYGSNFNFPTAILIAAAIIALMVLGFDLLFLTVQRLMTPWRKARPT
jgi:osmoprotectant transport system permease protein